MAYNAPNLSQLRTNVARDLRDPAFGAFTTAEVNDYINDGISELNEVRPVEARLTIQDVDGLLDLGLVYIWKVESNSRTNNGQNIIPPNNDEVLYPNGWQFYAGDLILPAALAAFYATAFDQGTIELVVYGYSHRDPLVLDDQVADFGLDLEEQAVRQYAKWRGLDALQGDRRLFQQWQTAANNSDVSPTQLSNMEQVAESEWTRTRRRIYAIRRPAAGQ